MGPTCLSVGDNYIGRLIATGRRRRRRAKWVRKGREGRKERKGQESVRQLLDERISADEYNRGNEGRAACHLFVISSK